MGKPVQQANISDLGKPRFLIWTAVGQGIYCSCIQRIFWKMTDHAENAELSLVENSLPWEAARHEVDESLRCSRVELQKTADGLLVVLINEVYFQATQEEASAAREKYWDTIDLLQLN